MHTKIFGVNSAQGKYPCLPDTDFDLAGQLLGTSLLLSAALKFTLALHSYFLSIGVKIWKVSFDRKYVIRKGNLYRRSANFCKCFFKVLIPATRVDNKRKILLSRETRVRK